MKLHANKGIEITGSGSGDKEKTVFIMPDKNRENVIILIQDRNIRISMEDWKAIKNQI
jgi:hypothetical protein